MSEICDAVRTMDIIYDLIEKDEVSDVEVGGKVPDKYCLTYSDGMYRVSFNNTGCGSYEDPEMALETAVDWATGNVLQAKDLADELHEALRTDYVAEKVSMDMTMELSETVSKLEEGEDVVEKLRKLFFRAEANNKEWGLGWMNVHPFLIQIIDI